VGKTELAKSLATALLDTEENMVRIGYTDGELNVVDENQA
jgi:ATP-dependent Clp protease ATP-binding subunit ClpA